MSNKRDKRKAEIMAELLDRTANLSPEEAEEALTGLKERASTSSDDPLADESFQFGSERFWGLLDDSKERDLDPDCVGLEVFNCSIHFLECRGYSKDDVMGQCLEAFAAARETTNEIRKDRGDDELGEDD